jgi:hypothetical protein
MESSVEYFYENHEIRAKYNNLYYINNKFSFLTTDKNIELKKVRITITDELIPIVTYFENIDKLWEYINTVKFTEIKGITGYLSHYFDWNVAHGLYDSLYPIYLTYLRIFYKDDIKLYTDDYVFNIFINLKFIPGWKFPGISSREWVLDIFKQFSGGKFIKENDTKNYIKENFKFETLILGNALAGITAVNKNGEMPGRDIYALEKYRDRMLKMYNIKKTEQNNSNKKKVIGIINSRRYTEKERGILLRIVQEFKNKGYDSEYIYWENIHSFKEQLELMNKIDIHISGAGTSMLNFPFLRDNCVHINLGANPIVGLNIPGLMEVNISLLSNNIYCDYYDIFNCKMILYEPLLKMITNYITNDGKHQIQVIPEYIKLWRTYCIDNDVDILIKRLNGIIKPHLMTYRWLELLYFKQYPFNDKI